MPSFETMDRHQKAVLFPREGTDGYNEPVRGDAVELDVRWNTKRTIAYDPKGTPIALDATAVVDQRVEVGSQMWLGELADWVGTGSALLDADSELHDVATYHETKDIKGRYVRRTVGLVKFRATSADAGG